MEKVDLDGQEIYEKDIYEFDYPDYIYGERSNIIKRSTGREIVKDIFDTWRIKQAASEGKGVKVIGNIFTTPELIKQESK